MKSMGANGLFNLSKLDPSKDEETAYRELRSALRLSLAGK
jgi:hypothetical protein